jgi:SulP family sulfate permease
VQESHTVLFRRVGVLAALRHHKHLFVDFEGALEHARSHVERARRTVET